MQIKKLVLSLLLFLALPPVTILFGAESLYVTQVTLREDIQTRLYPGRVVAMAQVNIVARVNGEIKRVGFKNGETVKAGTILYELDSIKYQAEVKNAEAKIAEYKARMAYASGNYERNSKLFETAAVSQDALESSLSARNAYQAALEAAEADLVSAQDDLAHCNITAPIDGKIGTTNFTFGNYVTINSGTLVTIVQTNPIRVRFAISNRDYLSMFDGKPDVIRQRGKVELQLSNGQKYLENGTIEYVENVANEGTDTICVFAKFDNASQILTPGNTVEVSIGNTSGAKKPAIPPTAVLQDARGSYVWVVKQDNSVEKRYITRGSLQDGWQLVEDGLKAGDRIVADGGHKVRANTIVHPIELKPTPNGEAR